MVPDVKDNVRTQQQIQNIPILLQDIIKFKLPTFEDITVNDVEVSFHNRPPERHELFRFCPIKIRFRLLLSPGK
jgi:hypothetical protein